ncbi:MAG: hypothetical protein J6J81_03665, partial [Oscillospiraceae bacterium]|nr:hypothetical protein [Oscillospiraceae bacterium]
KEERDFMKQYLDNPKTRNLEDGAIVTLHYSSDENSLQDCMVRVLQKHMVKERKNGQNKPFLL